MAPKLSKIQRSELQDIIISKLNGEEDTKDEDIANTIIRCSTRTVRSARSNIRQHGTIDAPRKPLGRPKAITPNMWRALQGKIDQTSGLTQEDMANFLHKAYGVKVSRFTVGRALKRGTITKKVNQNIAAERDEDLRDDYLYRRSFYKPEQMIFIDESGCDRGLAIAKKGYAPRGVTPRQVKRFHRGKRIQILPAYTMDGVLYCEIYEGNTDTEVFEGFIRRLIPHCGRYPEPRSVLFMDNASFHFSPKIKELIDRAGLIAEYSTPYSPDICPIEYFFGSLKNRTVEIYRGRRFDTE